MRLTSVVSSSCFFTLALLVLALVVSAEDFYQLLGITRQANAREIRKAFKKLALDLHPDKNKDDPNAHDNFLKINRAYEVLKDEELRKKYDMYGEDGLKEDGPSGRGYQSWNYYKQDFGIYDDDPEIITLSRADFEQSVLNTGDVWFINFYSPRCSHCHTLAPTWREVARELEGVVRIGAVNCGDEWQLCRHQSIHSYPSLLMFPQREKYMGERSTEELVKYALRNINARVLELWSGNFDSELKQEGRQNKPWLITYCGDGGDCLETSTSTKLSAMLTDLVTVASVDCHSNTKLCSKLGVDHGTYFYDAGQVTKGKGLEITTLVAREVANEVLAQLPDVKQLSASDLETALLDLQERKGQPWIIHFVEGEFQDLELRKLPALMGDMSVGRVDCKLQRTKCNDLHVHKFPTFAVFKSGGGHEIHHGRQTAQDIAAFARECAQTSVRILTPKDFPEKTRSTEPWFIDFYAPWCPPCMRLLPEFRKASKQMANIHFGTVDCTIHTSLCQNYGVQSYPTTVLYNQSVPHRFHGHHSAQHIVQFLQDTLHPPVTILSPDSFKQLVEGRSKDVIWLVDFFAPWCGPCQQLAPEWRQLAKMVKNNPKIEVGQVDCDAHKALCTANNVRSYPTIRLYPPGSKGANSFHVYNGWYRDAQSIRAWAFEFLPSKSVSLDYNTFVKDVLKSKQPWIVDFYAPWCGHCQVFAPEFERIAQAVEGRVKAAKVDCDREQYLCRQAGIGGYPTLRFYRGTQVASQQSIYGEEIDSQDGNYIIGFLNRRVPKTTVQGKDEL